MNCQDYKLIITTQGPTYPPSEIMDEEGNFVVIGMLNMPSENKQGCIQKWGSAIVSTQSSLPSFGENVPYNIIKTFDSKNLKKEDDCVLYTLPLPLPCNNYPMTFAPQQKPCVTQRKSYPLHKAPIPDLRENDGRKRVEPIMLSEWVNAKGDLNVSITPDKDAATFEFEFVGLIPDSLYTVMALRECDLDSTSGPTRPGPLGVPNVFITDKKGRGHYNATMPNPFPSVDTNDHNRIINIVLLWMSTQMSYGGAIGHYGLGGDIHAQLKLQGKNFLELTTYGR
jgi:hypothetical protein